MSGGINMEEIRKIAGEELERLIAENPDRFQGPPGMDGDPGYIGAPGAKGEPGVCDCFLCGFGRFLRRL